LFLLLFVPNSPVGQSTNTMAAPSIEEKKVYGSETDQHVSALSVEEGDVAFEQEAAKALRK